MPLSESESESELQNGIDRSGCGDRARTQLDVAVTAVARRPQGSVIELPVDVGPRHARRATLEHHGGATGPHLRDGADADGRRDWNKMADSAGQRRRGERQPVCREATTNLTRENLFTISS